MKRILKYIENKIPEPPVIEEQDYQQDEYSLDATATYMFRKILLNEKYSLGKKMNLLIRRTNGHHLLPKETNFPPPVSIIEDMGEK